MNTNSFKQQLFWTPNSPPPVHKHVHLSLLLSCPSFFSLRTSPFSLSPPSILPSLSQPIFSSLLYHLSLTLLPSLLPLLNLLHFLLFPSLIFSLFFLSLPTPLGPPFTVGPIKLWNKKMTFKQFISCLKIKPFPDVNPLIVLRTPFSAP